MTHHNTPDTANRTTSNTANASSGTQADRQNDKADFAHDRTYWRNQFAKEPYYESGQQFSDFESAYQVGYQGRGRHTARSFDQVEPDLRSEWEASKGSAKVGWEKAKHAVRAAWDRVEDAIPGDSNWNGH